MTKEIAIELLQNIVDICGAGNTFEGQVKALVEYGFTKEDLMYFGFSEEDLDKCDVDIYSRGDEISRVTLWYTLEDDDFGLCHEYNHLEDGWQNSAAPKPMSKQQERAWAKKSWWKKHCRLINGKVVE